MVFNAILTGLQRYTNMPSTPAVVTAVSAAIVTAAVAAAGEHGAAARAEVSADGKYADANQQNRRSRTSSATAVTAAVGAAVAGEREAEARAEPGADGEHADANQQDRRTRTAAAAAAAGERPKIVKDGFRCSVPTRRRHHVAAINAPKSRNNTVSLDIRPDGGVDGGDDCGGVVVVVVGGGDGTNGSLEIRRPGPLHEAHRRVPPLRTRRAYEAD